MRLLDLHPKWLGAGGEGVSDKDGKPVPERTGVALICDCPCGCGTQEDGYGLAIMLANPLDGGLPIRDRPLWQRTGEMFETLTLTPSILRSKERGGCGWHGFITAGEVLTC